MSKIESQVEEYLDYCEKIRGMTNSTMIMKRNVLFRFVKVVSVSDLVEITNEIFNKWMKSETSRGASASSVNTYNSIVIAMIRYYRELNIGIPLNLSLIKKLKEGEIRRCFYTVGEINRAIKMADLQTGLIIRIMFETGMRIAEVVHLRLINITGRQIRFLGKGKKSREVYITDNTLSLLRRYIEENEVKDYVWGFYEYGGNGEAPTTNTIRNRMKKAFETAGYYDFYPHSLRHSFATDLQKRGASVAEIKEMIGHENIATTERYLHGFDGKMRELFDKYR